LAIPIILSLSKDRLSPNGGSCVSIIKTDFDRPPETSLCRSAGNQRVGQRFGRIWLALARRKNCLFGLTHNYSGYPLVRAARELVAAGELGELRIIQVEYAQDWLSLPLEEAGNAQASWRTDPALAGPAGCLGDIGSHAAHLAEFVIGMSPSEISADLASFVPGRRVDDHVQIQLRYAGGARGLLWASQVACGEENGLRLRVYGTRGTLRWQQESPDELWLARLGEPTQRLTRGMPGLPAAAVVATRLPPGHPEGFIGAFAQIYSDFAADVRQHVRGAALAASRVPGLEEGVRSLLFIEAALESHRQNGRWTSLPLARSRSPMTRWARTSTRRVSAWDTSTPCRGERPSTPPPRTYRTKAATRGSPSTTARRPRQG